MSIHELANIAKQMEEMRSRLLGPTEQLRKQLGLFETQSSLLRDHALMRDSLLGESSRIATLTAPTSAMPSMLGETSRIATLTAPTSAMPSLLGEASRLTTLTGPSSAMPSLLGEASRLTTLTGPAFEASRSIRSMLDATMVNSSVANFMAVAADVSRQSSISKVNATSEWLGALNAANTFQGSSYPVQSHLGRLYDLTAIAEVSLSTVRAGTLGHALGMGALESAKLGRAQERFGKSYQTLFGFYRNADLGILDVPHSLTELPAVEFVNQSALIVSASETKADPEASPHGKKVTREIAAEAEDALTELLQQSDPRFVNLLKGSRAAYQATYPDRIRHFAVSLRELFTHVLELLSPVEEVKNWTTNADDFHNGRPTRRARLRFITRNTSQAFGGFVTADVGAAVLFLDSFQKGTHALEPDLSDAQVSDLKIRMEGLLRFLLTIAKVTC